MKLNYYNLKKIYNNMLHIYTLDYNFFAKRLGNSRLRNSRILEF